MKSICKVNRLPVLNSGDLYIDLNIWLQVRYSSRRPPSPGTVTSPGSIWLLLPLLAETQNWSPAGFNTLYLSLTASPFFQGKEHKGQLACLTLKLQTWSGHSTTSHSYAIQCHGKPRVAPIYPKSGVWLVLILSQSFLLLLNALHTWPSYLTYLPTWHTWHTWHTWPTDLTYLPDLPT